MKRIIISGGNFVNKGAEAMLYITVNECITRFKGCICVVQLPEGFFEVQSIEDLHVLSKGKRKIGSSKVKKLIAMIKNYVRADMMIDISGYELCSKFKYYPTIRYLFKIALCKWTRTRVSVKPSPVKLLFEAERTAFGGPRKNYFSL